MENITKQKDVLNGNEAYLIGIDREGSQIWLEVINGNEIVCNLMDNEILDLKRLLPKRVIEDRNILLFTNLINQYATLNRYLKKHPEQSEHRNSKNYLSDLKAIIEIVQPTN